MTTVECVCHGVSGSCTVQTCFKKVPDILKVALKLLAKYDAGELEFCEFSPNFCQRNLENGIFGTSDRQCWQNESYPKASRCPAICCGGPVKQRLVRKEDKDCKFVWCCRIECVVKRVYYETEYYCK